MARLLSTALLAASASAQITTSWWSPKIILSSDKVGFVGSVIDVQGDKTTISIDFDAGVDTSALSIGMGGSPYTIGPGYVGVGGLDNETVGGRIYQEQHCEKSPDDDKVTCTIVYQPEFVRRIECDRETTLRSDARTETSFWINTYTLSYPARTTYQSGVTTLTETMTIRPQTIQPPVSVTWCNNTDFTPEPSTATFTMNATEYYTYPLTITAGLDKLPASATASTGVAPSSSAPPTGSGSAPGQQSTNVGPLQTAAPALLGLGAAAAALFL